MLFFPPDIHEGALTALQRFRVTAVGRRPIDFAVRDLLTASYFRDGRLTKLKKLVRDSPQWLVDLVEHLPQMQSAAITQLAVHYLHRARITSLRSSIDPDSPLEPLLRRIDACWPLGLLVRPVTVRPDNADDVKPQTCGSTRFCPFCYARKVWSLMSRLKENLGSIHTGKIFVLARLTVTEAFFDSCSQSVPQDQQVEMVSHDIRLRLRRSLERLGAGGGLTVFQIAPGLNIRRVQRRGTLVEVRTAGLEYHVSVLAEFSTRESQFALKKAHEQNFEAQRIDIGGLDCLKPNWNIIGGNNPNALRFALIGGSRYAQHSSGGDGAFAPSPWMLGNLEQWQDAHRLGNAKRLFDLWGSWWSACQGKDLVSKTFTNAKSRRPRHKKMFGLRAKNSERKQTVRRRLDEFLPFAETIVAQLDAKKRRHLGRCRIATEFANIGIPISDKDARRIAKRLGETKTQ